MAVKKSKSNEEKLQVRKQYICILPDPMSPVTTKTHSYYGDEYIGCSQTSDLSPVCHCPM